MKLAYSPLGQLLWLIADTTVAIVPLTAAEPPKRATGGRASAYIAKWGTSPPQAGACCDLLTGACVNSFASLCDGYLEVFTPAVSCAEVQCTQPENVPTISQWAMVVLGALLLIGLTLKFGRHRAVA